MNYFIFPENENSIITPSYVKDLIVPSMVSPVIVPVNFSYPAVYVISDVKFIIWVIESTEIVHGK